MASLPPFCKVLIIVIGPKITEMDMLKAIILEKESVKVFLYLKIYKVFYDKIKIIGGLFIMAREKKSVHKVQMTDGKRNIIRQLLEEYEIESAQDIQDALKDLLGGTIKEMMESEMDEHLGYRKSERSDCDDYRNGYKTKQVNSSYGSMKVEVPQDRNSTFEPQVVKKCRKRQIRKRFILSTQTR